IECTDPSNLYATAVHKAGGRSAGAASRSHGACANHRTDAQALKEQGQRVSAGGGHGVGQQTFGSRRIGHESRRRKTKLPLTFVELWPIEQGDQAIRHEAALIPTR